MMYDNGTNTGPVDEDAYRRLVLGRLRVLSDLAEDQRSALRTIRGIAIFYVVMTLIPIIFGVLALLLGLLGTASLFSSLR
jgi:hypothetical protein